MADALITSAESNSIQHGLLTDASSDGSLSHRRIEYHKERKPFTGFSKSNGSGNFRLVVLNPSSPDSHETSGSIPEGRLQSVGGKRQDGSELMNAGGDSELSSRITFKRIGAGLQNLGNTCFPQFCVAMSHLYRAFSRLFNGRKASSTFTAGFCALCALQNHVSCAIESTGRSVAPKYLVSNLRCISRNFRNARQEDAHEYMVNLLESMHKCCLPKGIPSESPVAYDKSFVHKIFGGRLRSQVKCMQCSSCSNKFDPFLDLSLEINKADSIEKALTNFTAKEYLDGGERQYQCQKCKQKVKALKQLTVHKAPDVLAVHLKRFSAFRPDQKIDKNVHFGSTLDLKPYVSGNHDGDLKYTLYGVLVHHGSTTRSGHYYSFIRTSSGLWYKLDDHQVRQVGVKMVLTEKAYMLFYVRERRNCAPKQPAKVVQRDSANVTRENCSQLMKETVQNGLIDKIMNEHPSTAVIQHAASTVDSVKETHLTEASKQETNSLVITDSSILKKHNASDVSSSQPTEPMDVVTGSSAPQPNGIKCSTTSDHLKDFERVIENPIFTVADAKSNPCSNERTSKIEQTDSVLVKSNLCNHQASVVEEEGRRNEDADFSKHNEVNCTKKNMGDAAELPDCNGHSTSAADVVMEESSPKIGDGTHSQNSDGNLQRTDAEKEMIKASSMANNRSEDGETPRILESMKISDVQTAQISVKVNHDHKRRRKMRTKPKCQITSIHFSSGILLGASLTIQKKKHKKVKRRATKLNNLTEEDLLGKKSNLKEFGPSTSESTTRPVHVDGPDYSKQTSRSNSSEIEKIPTANSNVVGGGDVEFKSRLGQHGAVLATDKQSKNVSSSLAGTQWDDRVDDGSHSMQKSAMSMLTRGLEETIVARWDGIDLSSSQVPGSSGADALKIGYVADEWDEEYDRGKRKKVRDTKDVFGGPNLFQQIATKKAKTKHTRTKQRDSGNQPFRIR